MKLPDGIRQTDQRLSADGRALECDIEAERHAAFMEAVERMTATAERYGNAIVAISGALKDAPTADLAVIRVRTVLAGLAEDEGPLKD